MNNKNKKTRVTFRKRVMAALCAIATLFATVVPTSLAVHAADPSTAPAEIPQNFSGSAYCNATYTYEQGYSETSTTYTNWTGLPSDATMVTGWSTIWFSCQDHTAMAPPAGMTAYYSARLTDWNEETGVATYFVYFYQHGNMNMSDGVTIGSDGVNLGGVQRMGGNAYLQFEIGKKLSLKKVSANPSITNGNSCYSLEGAVYGVYSDAGCTTKVDELRTDANGKSNEVTLPKGNYWVKEISAPKGYYLDETIYPVDLTSDKILSVEDIPGNDPVQLVLSKVDAETLRGKPIGGTKLEGAEYTLKYYDVDMTTDPAAAGKTALWTWVLKTDTNGLIYLDDAHKVSGPGYYKDASGNAVFPLGTATIQETKAPEGYLLNDEIFVVNTRMQNNIIMTTNLPNNDTLNSKEPPQRGDFTLRKIDADTQKKMAGVSFEIISLDKNGQEVESHIITTDANGYYSSASSYVPHSTNTNSGAAGSGTWFGVGSTVDDSRGALPYGEYIIREIRGANNANYTMYEDTFWINGNNVTIALGNIENKSTPPEIQTEAVDGETKNHVGVVSKKAVIIDTVKYKHLPFEELTFEGKLVEAGSGTPLRDANGNEITSSTTITVTENEGTATVTFEFDSSALAGMDVVVFEKVIDINGRVVGEHEDPNDPPQTVHYPKLGTNAVDGQSKNKIGTVSANSTIVDTVDYKNLVPGLKYKISGAVWDKATGKEVPGVTASAEFTPTSSDGKMEVTFKLNTTSLVGHSLVVFEKLFVAKGNDWVEVANHEDINDTAQTVTYNRPPNTNTPPSTVTPPKTGDMNRASGMAGMFSMSAMALFAIATILIRRKKRA